MALLLSSVLTKKKVIDEYYMDDTMAVKWGGCSNEYNKHDLPLPVRSISKEN